MLETTELTASKVLEPCAVKIASTVLRRGNNRNVVSLSGGNYKEEKDISVSSRSGHVSDYDILVVTEKKDSALNSLLWGRISKELQNLNLSAFPKILTHDIQELNKKLSEGQYFFSDIKKEGILLFDTGRFELAEKRNLSAEETQQIAQKHFDYWFNRAQGFYKHFMIDFENPNIADSDNGLIAFNLHQVAESCYKGILLVFTNYTPREHFLEILGKKAEECDSGFKDIFSKTKKEDEERFNLLEYAYIGGRYDPDYYISKEDLDILLISVQKLVGLTEELCKKKIASLVP